MQKRGQATFFTVFCKVSLLAGQRYLEMNLGRVGMLASPDDYRW